MRIVFLGRTHILMKTIEMIEKTDYTIVGIGTCKAAPEYLVTEKDFEKKAKQLNVPFFCDSKINSKKIQTFLFNLNADIAISINWLTIIGRDTIACFKHGILNGHMGDLPKYRGNACPNWAIIRGENRIGVTVHMMNPSELDSGDIIEKRYIEIGSSTAIGDIYNEFEKMVPEMFIEAVSKLVHTDKKIGIAQSKERKDILRCYPRIPSDSCIDWNSTCKQIDRIIRASSSPFIGAYSFLNGEKVYILEGEVKEFEYPCCVIPGQVVYRDCSIDEVGIATKDGVVAIKKIKNECQEIVPVTSIVKSTRNRMGIVMQDVIYEMQKQLNDLKKEIEIIKNKS